MHCILKLGLINPLPEKLIKDFAAKVDKVVVLEELDPDYRKSLQAAWYQGVG
mgnify:CR=1 FL=1